MCGQYLAVWEFQVKPEFVERFEQVYGGSGAWAALFRRSPEHLATELIRDLDHLGRYLTIDRWTSREAFLRFKHDHAAEYASFDENCEWLTLDERLIGHFESFTPPASAPSPRP